MTKLGFDTQLLISCHSVEEYAHVSECYDSSRQKIIPVLGKPAKLSGIPASIGCISYEHWIANKAVINKDLPVHEKLCLVVDELHCNTIGFFLAQATQRTFFNLKLDSWQSDLGSLLADRNIESLSFIIPSWDDAGQPDARWIKQVIRFTRTKDFYERLQGVAWGILTGVTPSTLSTVIAKTILQSEISASYANSSAALFVTDAAADLGIDISTKHKVTPTFQLIDKVYLSNNPVNSVTDERWSMLYFKGHGRNYCACQGYLCGARSLNVEPTTPAEKCVLGLDCANPYDDAFSPGLKAFPRIDPRSYDTQVMILDCCSSGGWSWPDMEAGIPSISMHAAAGAPTAVISSDFTTVEQPGDYLDVLRALWSSNTFGESVSRLNLSRSASGAEFPYFLLGDPDSLLNHAASTNWWCDASILSSEVNGEDGQLFEITIPVDKPYIRFRFKSFNTHTRALYIHSADPSVIISAARAYHDETSIELWMSVMTPEECEQPFGIFVEDYPAPAFPAGVVDAALSVSGYVRSWNEKLAEGALELLDVAERILSVHALIEDMPDVVMSDPQGLYLAVELCQDAWTNAHLSGLEHVLNLSTDGFWHFQIWKSTNYSGSSVSTSCPYCGTTPTLQRCYHSPPKINRAQWECPKCAVIEDRPLMPSPLISINMPGSITSDQTINVELMFDNSQEPSQFTIACALVIDQRGHGIQSPPPFALRLAAGECHVECVELTLTGSPPIAHQYWVRVLTLINGCWTFATRCLVVSP